MMKGDIWKMLMEYLVEEEIVSDEEEVLTSTSVVKLKKLELKDKERECESQLRLKEIELKEHELVTQLKMKCNSYCYG